MTENISGRWRSPRGAVTTDREITSVSEDCEEESLPSVIVGATVSVLRGSEVGQLRYVDAGGATVGRDEASKLRFSDPTVSRRHARLTLHDNAFQLVDLDSANGTFVDEARVDGTIRLPSSCRLRFGPRTVVQFSAVDEMGSQAFERLRRALFMDPLTGSGNRTFLDLRMREEISFGRRHGQTIAVLLADLDHFKRINDRFGHVIGDRFLKRVGQILADCVRTEDSVYRYGGEEFCVLVRGIGLAGLIRMAERIRVAIEAFELPVADEVANLTVSLGIASLVPGEDEPEGSTLAMDMDEEPADVASQLIRRADAALYLAKGRGRNCIEVYSEDSR
jgi:two-component system, cell cycle response regulator